MLAAPEQPTSTVGASDPMLTPCGVRRLAWTLLVLLLLAAAPGGPATSSTRQLAAARAAVKDLEYERARDLLQIAIADPASDETTRLEAHLLNGIVQRVLQNDVEARLSFRYVLERQPDAQLPAGASPKVVSFFELVRAEVKTAARPAVLIVRSEPASAVVAIDGQVIGSAPVTRAIGSGWHDVELTPLPVGSRLPVKVAVNVVESGETAVYAELYRVEIPLREQEQFAERRVWHNIAMGSKLGLGALLLPTCGCCLILGAGPMSRADFQALLNPVNLSCMFTGLAGLFVGSGLLGWGAFDLIVGPQPAAQRVFHRITITPPAGQGTPLVQEITAGAPIAQSQAY